MQKWCPESLAPSPVAGTFEPMAPAVSASLDPNPRGFRSEAGFSDPHNLLRQLSREEREQILELLEQDLRRENEERYARDAAIQAQAEAERLHEEDRHRERWQHDLSEGLRREMEDALATMARQTVDMARMMATKLVRREVEQDPEVLVRALETVLYKSEAGCPLSVTVHPDDAAWLASAATVCERLRIREIKEDRRLERGGCLVKTGDLEWDATIARQLDVLSEALAEALAVPPEPTPVEEPAPAPPEDQDA